MDHKKRAWIVAANMGYGHARTAYALKDIAEEGVLIANDYDGIPDSDKRIWEASRKFYESVSQLHDVPIIGGALFHAYDQLQKIYPFYPYRDLSRPNMQVRQMYGLIRRGWGRHLIEKLSKNPLSLFTSFFAVAFMAEELNYPGDIYCIICDADVSRTWAPLDPQKSRIYYCASTERAARRLREYGVKPDHVLNTGYPLPPRNIGVRDEEIVKANLAARLYNLDPERKYLDEYAPLVKERLGAEPERSGRPLTLMFAVGGAGVQKSMGLSIVKSFRRAILERKIKIVLVAGTREPVRRYFEDGINREGLGGNEYVEVLYAPERDAYFGKFNDALRTTDVLWTKPSELSLYSALGIPVLIAHPIGSQEEHNQQWLLELGAGVLPRNPAYSHEWFFDYLRDGKLAKAAMQGFVEGNRGGTRAIEKIIGSR